MAAGDAIGETECDAFRAMGARTFVTRAAFTQAATLSSASGSGSMLGKRDPENERYARLSRLQFKDDTRHRRTSRRTSRMKS
jgi:hypothetical protein